MCNEMITLSTPMEELENSILEENNIDNLNNIIDVFNVNLKKKDIIRSSKLSELQDKIVDQMFARMDKRGDEFSNGDLIQMHKAINDTLSKSDTTLDNVKTPTIQINQQVNIANEQTFDRESRQRILNAVNEIINGTSSLSNIENVQNIEEVEVTKDGLI